MKKYNIKEVLSTSLFILIGSIFAALAIFLASFLRGDSYLSAYTHFVKNEMIWGVCDRLKSDSELALDLGYDEYQEFYGGDLKDAFIIDLYNDNHPVLMCFMSNDFGDVYTIVMLYRNKRYYYHDTLRFSTSMGTGASEYHLLLEGDNGNIHLYDYTYSKDGEGNVLRNAKLYTYDNKDTPVYSFYYDSSEPSNCLENGITTDKTAPDNDALENYDVLIDSRNYYIRGGIAPFYGANLDKFLRG